MPIQYNHFQKQLAALFILSAIVIVSSHGLAAKKETVNIREASVYIIKDGDYLGGIAMANGVSIADLIEANGLDNPDKIYSGMELMIPGARMNSGENKAPVKKKQPTKVIVEVPKGFTLTRIAKTYGISIAAIVRANKKLDNPDNLRAGMKILIPGATKEIELVPPPPCFNPAVEFYRIRNDKTAWVHLTYCNGRANPAGVEKLSQFTSPTNLKKMPFPLHPRLAVMLQKVANKFPGRRLEVVSGQRTQKKKNHESFHNKGQAIDFRVQGIPNRTLVNFVRQFDNSGVGYYPNSVFIHMDTRKKNAFWIDYAGPGEKAIYARAGLSPEDVKKIRAARLEKKAAAKAKSGNTNTARSSNIKENIVADNSAVVEQQRLSKLPAQGNTDAQDAEKADKQSSDSTTAEAPINEIASIQSAGQV